jgi:7,8-dihydropterin-6-yl-methyl-4-(beta-D-ribofuranosyl)aminobenzene 5'-phosphate synthase
MSNEQRLARAGVLDLPELEYVDLNVLVEWYAADGFQGDAGVSYLFQTDRGSLLFDVGFGPTRPALAHNARQLNLDPDGIDALAISHLHPDHMGGLGAVRSRRVMIPDELVSSKKRSCFLPLAAEADGFDVQVVEEPRLLAAGIVSTGPLARSLAIPGYCEEQSLVARIRDKGLMVITGCGHPTIEVILRMVARMSDEPIYAIGGGLHFPVTGGRGARLGIDFQTIIGTGKPLGQRVTGDDLSRTISAINEAGPEKVLLSAHDTCDHALKRFKNELGAETAILEAGKTYRL